MMSPGPAQFKCPHCDKHFSTLSANASHQKIHSCDGGFKFCCPKPSCSHKYEHLASLSYHIKTVHPAVRSAVEPQPGSSSSLSSTWSMKCSVDKCTFISTSFSNHCQHVITHVASGGVAMLCPLSNFCKQDLRYGGKGNNEKEVNRLRSHLSLYHCGWRENKLKPPEPQSFLTAPSSSLSSAETGAFDDQSCTLNEDACSSNTDYEDEPCNHDALCDLFAKFYLMLEAELLLPELSVQHICDRLAFVSEMVLDQTKSNLIQALKNHDVEEEKVTPIVNEVLAADAFYLVHHKDASGPNLTSNHYRKSYYHKHFNLTDPKEEPLDLDTFGESVVYVPIKNTLSLLLKDPTVKKEIYESFERNARAEDGVYEDYYSGSVCKSRPSYVKKRIDLNIFQDGFSVTNPIGSAKTLHKLIGTYFSIGNMKAFLRSKLKFIHMVSLFYEKQLKDPTIGFECFRPLIQELQELATEGIDFDGMQLPVVVQFLIGDNLGSHIIGGFIECFSSVYFCRFCEITRNEFHNDPSLVKDLRSPHDYSEALQELNELKRTQPDKRTHRGVSTSSEFNKLPDFHVCDPGLPPCLGHDLFEGVVAWDVYAIILKLVELNWFSLEKLNQRIEHFDYLLSDSGNKPAPLNKPESKKIKTNRNQNNDALHNQNLSKMRGLLKGHAVQNWCFLRILPFLLEGLIKDPSNEHWQLYLKLKTVVEYACKPTYVNEDIQKFDAVVQDYLKSRSNILIFIRPKHHFLAHYPKLIPLLGPLIHLWTLRFESKHSYFKQVARICKNYINLTITLANKHQLFLCYLGTGTIFPAGYSKSKETKVKNYPESLSSMLLNAGIQHDAIHYDELAIDEVHYKRNLHILLENGEDDVIMTGRIEAIVMPACGGAVFALKVFTANLWKEFGVYKIDTSKSSLRIVKSCDLKHPIPHPVYEFNDEECFSLKYKI